MCDCLALSLQLMCSCTRVSKLSELNVCISQAVEAGRYTYFLSLEAAVGCEYLFVLTFLLFSSAACYTTQSVMHTCTCMYTQPVHSV